MIFGEETLSSYNTTRVLPFDYISFTDAIKHIVYDQNKDVLYVIHRKLNPINDKDIVTTGLIMPKDIYDHSNLLDIEKIYSEDLKNEETEEK